MIRPSRWVAEFSAIVIIPFLSELRPGSSPIPPNQPWSGQKRSIQGTRRGKTRGF